MEAESVVALLKKACHEIVYSMSILKQARRHVELTRGQLVNKEALCLHYTNVEKYYYEQREKHKL